MIKFHDLYEFVKIEKETEKAVFILSKKLTNENIKDFEDLNRYSSIVGAGCYSLKKSGFWLPKSQIKLENGFITAVTKWIYNQHINFYDFPMILKSEVEELQKKYLKNKQAEAD